MVRTSELFIAAHHLVMDGISWRIIQEDLLNGLKQLAAGQEIALAKKTASYQQWADALYEYAQTDQLRAGSFLAKDHEPRGRGFSFSNTCTFQYRRTCRDFVYSIDEGSNRYFTKAGITSVPNRGKRFTLIRTHASRLKAAAHNIRRARTRGFI